MGKFGGFYKGENKKLKKAFLEKKGKNVSLKQAFVLPSVDIIKKGKNETK